MNYQRFTHSGCIDIGIRNQSLRKFCFFRLLPICSKQGLTLLNQEYRRAEEPVQTDIWVYTELVVQTDIWVYTELQQSRQISGSILNQQILIDIWVYTKLVIQIDIWVYTKLVVQIDIWVYTELAVQIDIWVYTELVVQIDIWV